jgi:hypothetical protein
MQIFATNSDVSSLIEGIYDKRTGDKISAGWEKQSNKHIFTEYDPETKKGEYIIQNMQGEPCHDWIDGDAFKPYKVRAKFPHAKLVFRLSRKMHEQLRGLKESDFLNHTGFYLLWHALQQPDVEVQEHE